jgi:hypothetical protein
MNTIVLYKSISGFTKKYAEWIAEELNADLYPIADVNQNTFSRYDTIKAYWEWFSRMADQISSRKMIMIGDFNIDPFMKKYKYRHHLTDLLQNGLQMASPADGSASFWANKNNAPHSLDHAFCTKNFTIRDAVYIQEVEGLWKCGENKYREPDHAILVVDFCLS